MLDRRAVSGLVEAIGACRRDRTRCRIDAYRERAGNADRRDEQPTARVVESPAGRQPSRLDRIGGERWDDEHRLREVAMPGQRVHLPLEPRRRPEGEHDPPRCGHARRYRRLPLVLVDEIPGRPQRQRGRAGPADGGQLALRRELPRDSLLERVAAAHAEQLEERTPCGVHARHRQPVVLERAQIQDVVTPPGPDGPLAIGTGVGACRGGAPPPRAPAPRCRRRPSRRRAGPATRRHDRRGASASTTATAPTP